MDVFGNVNKKSDDAKKEHGQVPPQPSSAPPQPQLSSSAPPDHVAASPLPPSVIHFKSMSPRSVVPAPTSCATPVPPQPSPMKRSRPPSANSNIDHPLLSPTNKKQTPPTLPMKKQQPIDLFSKLGTKQRPSNTKTQ